MSISGVASAAPLISSVSTVDSRAPASSSARTVDQLARPGRQASTVAGLAELSEQARGSARLYGSAAQLIARKADSRDHTVMRVARRIALAIAAGLAWGAFMTGWTWLFNRHDWQAQLAGFAAIGLLGITPWFLWSDRTAKLPIDTRRDRLERFGPIALYSISIGFAIGSMDNHPADWLSLSHTIESLVLGLLMAGTLGVYEYRSELRTERERISREAYEAEIIAREAPGDLVSE